VRFLPHSGPHAVKVDAVTDASLQEFIADVNGSPFALLCSFPNGLLSLAEDH